MTAVELLPPGEATPDNPRWHELRRAGVTASEIAVVMGLSKWDSPFNLYWSKVNGWASEDSEIMSTGRHLEASIADWWEATHTDLWDPALRLKPAGLYAHPERPWQLATPDHIIMRHVDGTHGVFRFADLLECKWVAYSWDGWGEPGTDEVPVHYRAQALWQADVMGVDEVHIAALGPGGFRAYLVRRDENDLAVMRKAGEDFVRRLTEGDPPPLDSHAATIGALKRLHPDVEDGEVEVSADLAEEYRMARAEKAEAEALVNGYEAQIRALLGSQRKAVCNGKLVASRSVYERKPYSVGPTTIDKLNPGRADSYV